MSLDAAPVSAPPRRFVQTVVADLQTWFEAGFSIWDATNDQLLQAGTDAPCDSPLLNAELLNTVAARGQPEFLLDEGPTLVLGIPIPCDTASRLVATAVFASRRADKDDDLTILSEQLGWSFEQITAWLSRQQIWEPGMLMRLARVAAAKFAADNNSNRLSIEVDKVSDNLASTYEEISLLYSLTQNLRLSSSHIELGQMAMDWLLEVAPAKGLALYFSDANTSETDYLTGGNFALGQSRFADLIEMVAPCAHDAPYVANHRITDSDEWEFPEIRQLVLVPLVEGDNIFGFLAAMNHLDGGEFGTVEAGLLSSVGAILGIHGGNISLYRQQADMVTGVVRALSSAIDAKDPYTCDHSDRVARIAVRLARELGVDESRLKNIYMGGLLHDIGKIGINDHVLRKPGSLTAEEYEHIKLHPTLGFKILKDIEHFSNVLPIVLHHHEDFNGGGYPNRLAGKEIPWEARITAVADAYDAMTSNRPYRCGMDDRKVDEIFRTGRGKQWDPQVIDAFFAARDDIYRIAHEDNDVPIFDAQHWS